MVGPVANSEDPSPAQSRILSDIVDKLVSAVHTLQETEKRGPRSFSEVVQQGGEGQRFKILPRAPRSDFSIEILLFFTFFINKV